MDDEILVSFSTKKKRLIYSFSSDEDQPIHKHKTQNCQKSQSEASESTRSSERIRKRKSRTFSLPSREYRWKDIPTEENVEKEIRKLTPVKLINNFTKENSRYNYDPVYTSGEESFDDFIDDGSNIETSENESESESKTRKRRRKRKIKYYHPRIVKESSSDTDSEKEKQNVENNFSSETDSEIEVKLRRNSAKSKSKCIESDSDYENSRKSTGVSNARKKLYRDPDNVGDDKEDSDDDVIAAVERQRGCIIDSDDGETDTPSEVKVEMTQIQSGSQVKVETDPEPQVNVLNDTDLVAKVKVEPVEVEYNVRDRQDSINKDVKAEIKVENVSYEEVDSFEIKTCNKKIDCVNNNENKAGTTRHDSGIVDDGEFTDKSMSSSGEEEEDWESSGSDIEVTSERTRVSMVKKKRKKEKLFEKFREARELKLHREAKRRQSEMKKETG